MGAALVGMVVELTRGRPDAAEHAAELDAIGTEASRLRSELVELTDLDADAYREVVAARRLPRDSDEERAAREARIVDATRDATLAPLRIARAAAATLDAAERLAPIGNPNAVSDVGVAALLAATALRGAALNVRINLPFLPPDDPLRVSADGELEALMADLDAREEVLRQTGRGPHRVSARLLDGRELATRLRRELRARLVALVGAGEEAEGEDWDPDVPALAILTDITVPAAVLYAASLERAARAHRRPGAHARRSRRP